MSGLKSGFLLCRTTSLCLGTALLAALGGCGGNEAASAGAPESTGSASSVSEAAAALNPLTNPKDEVAQVMDAFMAAKSYHVEMVSTGAAGMTMEMDFVAPDRYRMKTPTATQHIIGDTMYMTINGRTMKMPLPKDQIGQYRDPAKFAVNKASMTVEALGSESIDGQSAKKYRVHNTEPMPGESLIWVGSNGYPLQVEATSSAGGQSMVTTIRYSRFNDPTITVNAPQ